MFLTDKNLSLKVLSNHHSFLSKIVDQKKSIYESPATKLVRHHGFLIQKTTLNCYETIVVATFIKKSFFIFGQLFKKKEKEGHVSIEFSHNTFGEFHEGFTGQINGKKEISTSEFFSYYYETDCYRSIQKENLKNKLLLIK